MSSGHIITIRREYPGLSQYRLYSTNNSMYKNYKFKIDSPVF